MLKSLSDKSNVHYSIIANYRVKRKSPQIHPSMQRMLFLSILHFLCFCRSVLRLLFTADLSSSHATIISVQYLKVCD